MMMLVTGGASSGKSAYAETAALELPGPHYYLAAMKPFGEDGARRIARHRKLRAGKGFLTVECYEGLEAVAQRARELAGECCACADDVAEAGASVGVGAGASELPSLPDASASGRVRGTALLECLGNVVANELFADDGTQAAEADALRAVLGGIGMLVDAFDNLVIVGNEVGCDGVRYDDATQAYIRIIGAASCELACRCDTVVECICGQPLVVK